VELWKLHRGHQVRVNGKLVTIKQACCAVMFNVMGYLHETIKKEEASQRVIDSVIKQG
jgi:hypothetical protein